MANNKKKKGFNKSAISHINYKGRVEFLRQWMPRGFNTKDGYDLRKFETFSSAKKKIINEYYDAIQQLTSRAVYVYAPRSKKNQKIARESMGLGHLKKIDRAYIQVPTHIDKKGESVPTKPKIKIQRDALKIDFKGFARDVILFTDYGYTVEEIAENPAEIIDDIVSELDYNQYAVIAGLHEVGKGAPKMMSKNNISKKVSELINQYSKDDDHHWSNWLFGVIGYRFHPRQDVINYVNTIAEQSKIKRSITELISNLKKKINARQDRIRLINYSRNLKPEEKEKQNKKYFLQISAIEELINKLIIFRARGEYNTDQMKFYVSERMKIISKLK